MAAHNINPVREQLRAEILSVLANSRDPMTTQSLYHYCEYATSAEEVSRVAYEMKKKGLIADGGKVDHPRGSPVNSYVLAITEDPRIATAKPIKADAKIKPTRQPAIKRKPAPGHPFQAPISPKAPHDRITRPLPIHLQSVAPVAVLKEAPMSEDPTKYIPEDREFILVPNDMDTEEYTDEELIDELMAKMVPLPMADDETKDHEWTCHEFHLTEDLTPKKACKCLKLPPLPKGYAYGGIKVLIENQIEVGHLTIATHDEGGGAFASIKASGRLLFDPGDLGKISQVADALIELHDAMDNGHE